MDINLSAKLSLGGSGKDTDRSSNNPGNRIDPYLTFRFMVEIDGLIVGGFTDVSGLSTQTEVESKVFGGVNDMEYKFIKSTKCSDLILKKGIVDVNVLWDWYQQVINGNTEHKSGSIYLLNCNYEKALGWNFYDAFPIKWDGPTFNASDISMTMATESVVLTLRRLERISNHSGSASTVSDRLKTGVSIGGSVSFSIGI